ncbi:MAG: tripartite tricarboxylate transporter substrate binding protein [Mailhella sp.]|nr:tripartite tricarboxylate transporter substrate binding protein [Mailhella sp.]
MKRALLATLGVMFLAANAFAAYPEKSVTLIVPYGAGGGTDVTARMLAVDLEKQLGKSVVVENLGGGAGWIGWGKLAASKPDGYTIGYINVPNIYAGYLNPKMKRAESLNSFTLISNHVTDPCVWVVSAQSPYKSLKELIEAAQKAPGKFSLAAHGFGGDDHLAMMDIEKKTGTSFSVVHNKSTAESRSQLLGGHVDILGANVSEVFRAHKKGELRVLGVMGEKRSEYLPDVPTFKEQGIDAVWSVSRGIGTPAGLPEDIKQVLTDALFKALTSPEHKEKAQNLGLSLDTATGADYTKRLEATEKAVKALMNW